MHFNFLDSPLGRGKKSYRMSLDSGNEVNESESPKLENIINISNLLFKKE
jgi:hypothetical protein